MTRSLMDLVLNFNSMIDHRKISLNRNTACLVFVIFYVFCKYSSFSIFFFFFCVLATTFPIIFHLALFTLNPQIINKMKFVTKSASKLKIESFFFYISKYNITLLFCKQ